jgi:hypothetical protein
MKKRILVLVIGLLLIGINGYAADGDLIVNGNATVNSNLTVQGTIQGIKLVHVTGTNPTCPAGTGAILMRKWAPQTCSDSGGCGSCTIGGGWSVSASTCQYSVYTDFGEYGAACVATTCSPLNWTEAICMGN